MLNYLLISSLFLLTNPFPVGQTVTYERFYTTEHLRQHPGQEVTWMKMSITRCKNQGGGCIGDYVMSIDVALKNPKGIYGAFGRCEKFIDSHKIPYLRCGVLCDGGGFKVYGESKITLIPDDKFRVRLPQYDDGPHIGSPNPEHMEFVLYRK